MTREEVFKLIDIERRRQSRRWAGQHSWGVGDCSSDRVADTTKIAVLAEEIGEVARAVLDKDIEQIRNELVQVAAVATAWLEGLT